MKTLKFFGCLIGLLALCSCEQLNDYFESAQDKPLPGERISVLALDKGVNADPRIADLDVKLPPPYENEDWPQAGGYPNHAMHHIAVADVPVQYWRVSAGKGAGDLIRLTSVPIVADGKAFILDSLGNVAAFDITSGRRAWRYNITPGSEERGEIGGGLGFYQGVLYVTSPYGEVIAMLGENGSEVWRRRIGIPLRGAPTIVEDRLFALTADNQLFAIETSSGSVIWNHSGIAEDAAIVGAPSPAVQGGVVIAPYSSGELVALRVENGRILWSDSLARTGRLTSLAELNDINGSPVIDRDMVIAIGHSGRMVGIDLLSGARLWENSLSSIQMPWVAGDFVYVVTLDAQLVCLARNNGRIKWVQQLPRYSDPGRRKNPIEWSGPVLASDRLIVVSSKKDAVAVSPYNGDILSVLELSDKASLPPIVAGGTIFVLTDDGDLVAYR